MALVIPEFNPHNTKYTLQLTYPLPLIVGPVVYLLDLDLDLDLGLVSSSVIPVRYYRYSLSLFPINADNTCHIILNHYCPWVPCILGMPLPV